MGYRWLAIAGGDCDLPHAKLVLRHGGSIAVPVVEIADEEGAQGIGSPFAVHDVAILLDVEAVLLEPLRQALAVVFTGRMEHACPCELLHATLGVLDGLEPLLGFCVTAAQGRLERVEIGVELGDSCAQSACGTWGVRDAAAIPVPSFGAWPAGLSAMEFADASLSAMARGEGRVEATLCPWRMRWRRSKASSGTEISDARRCGSGRCCTGEQNKGCGVGSNCCKASSSTKSYTLVARARRYVTARTLAGQSGHGLSVASQPPTPQARPQHASGRFVGRKLSGASECQ